jgi:hypothetical protein
MLVEEMASPDTQFVATDPGGTAEPEASCHHRGFGLRLIWLPLPSGSKNTAHESKEPKLTDRYGIRRMGQCHGMSCSLAVPEMEVSVPFSCESARAIWNASTSDLIVDHLRAVYIYGRIR